ncbi:[FeFe] hydrogenase H-cluster maturation GTPase HydF [Mediterraneibacter glycyrrhizinilyticus]|uniref:[FeFe] hydrogenase H-cluster maturation GTPase HydF n=1 Tax=Mediterraneibacter glycyrrhizinilyticus TaxID=342942 RepID=UPI002659286E|nr:[FeFe] hydrogenase H-cluster maturation GTPase HydF [Mediterraneibacter glycyrrhizinilyticus]MCF2569698.1 [FeFe] hydrogenase H-cluster maturation GTPase HydF [Mediterraneibacter glycyrrhizinilyticus]
MGLNQTPMSERTHIGFFGKRNAGKSSVMNAVTGQELAVVSDVKGTTTDPVYKSMELLPLGPVVMMDTPGIDDEGELGSMRVRKSYQVLNKTDAAVLVIDGTVGASAEDEALLERIRKKNIPFIVVINKKELADTAVEEAVKRRLTLDDGQLALVSAATGEGIHELKERIASIARVEEPEKYLVRDLLEPSDVAVLVVPIDSAAPKGRLILPQQQTIRDILEADAVSVVVKENGVKNALGQLNKKPKMVITDSQVFAQVAADTPEDIQLTSFSILMARYKGNLEQAVRGVTALDGLEDGDMVLISEGCTHHRQCDDIGTVKIPRWIREYTGKDVQIVTSSGTEFPDDLKKYKLIIHCGGCMLNEREMKYRLSCAADQGVPMTNYGIMIAYVKGILKRSVQVFPDISVLLG